MIFKPALGRIKTIVIITILAAAALVGIASGGLVSQFRGDTRQRAADACWCTGADQCPGGWSWGGGDGYCSAGLKCCTQGAPPPALSQNETSSTTTQGCTPGQRSECGGECGAGRQKICQSNYQWGPCVNSQACGYAGAAVGTNCSLDSHCQSGHCDPTTKKCATMQAGEQPEKKSAGETCSSTTDCTAGLECKYIALSAGSGYNVCISPTTAIKELTPTSTKTTTPTRVYPTSSPSPTYYTPNPTPPPACSAGETKCSGSNLLTCNSARTGWNSTSCSAGCNSSLKRCNICKPNSSRCSSNQLQVCNSSGTGYDPASATNCRYMCVQNGDSASCRPEPPCIQRNVEDCTKGGITYQCKVVTESGGRQSCTDINYVTRPPAATPTPSPQPNPTPPAATPTINRTPTPSLTSAATPTPTRTAVSTPAATPTISRIPTPSLTSAATPTPTRTAVSTPAAAATPGISTTCSLKGGSCNIACPAGTKPDGVRGSYCDPQSYCCVPKPQESKGPSLIDRISSFFNRLIGRSSPSPTPAPSPASTPAPTPQSPFMSLCSSRCAIITDPTNPQLLLACDYKNIITGSDRDVNTLIWIDYSNSVFCSTR